jgi:hypothetical protein
MPVGAPPGPAGIAMSGVRRIGDTTRRIIDTAWHGHRLTSMSVPTKRPIASRIKVDPRVKDMPDDFLECRIGNHLFPFKAAMRQYRREWRCGRVRDMIYAEERCQRCGTTRFSYRERYEQNQIVAMWYEHPDGYANPVTGEGQIPRHISYLEMVRRYPPAGE